MTKTSARPAALLVALTLGLTTLAGCSETPQEKYDNAVSKLQDTRESRDEAQADLNDNKDELKALRDKIQESEDKLEEARKKVEAATLAVNETVNDEVLFRTIQRDVLDNDAFDEAAISVGVTNRVVTLTGNVPDEETHDKAVKFAREQAGVADVVDELEVAQDVTSAPPAAKSPSQAAPEQKPGPPSKPADAASESDQPSDSENDATAASEPGSESGDTSDKPPQSTPMGEEN